MHGGRAADLSRGGISSHIGGLCPPETGYPRYRVRRGVTKTTISPDLDPGAEGGGIPRLTSTQNPLDLFAREGRAIEMTRR